MTSHPDLPFEKAKNREYLEKLEAKLKRNPLSQVLLNPIWIDSAEHRVRTARLRHPLLGRVGCETDDDQVRDFYIGPRFVQDGDIQVYSWAAPIARRFFRPDLDVSGQVVVRRTFDHYLDDVVDVDEEWTRPEVSSPFIARDLTVPAPAPGSGTRRRRAGTVPDVPRTDSEPDRPSVNPHDAVPPRSTSLSPSFVAPTPPPPTPEVRSGMRAEAAVLKRLAAPRTDRLQSVLALLQPDQHAMATWKSDESIAVQGHPGTGKTIVAVYRAAYLVDPEHVGIQDGRAPAKRPRVLVVGPTAAYVTHVRGLLEALELDAVVEVTHVADLLIRTTGLPNPWPGRIGGEHDDVDAQARSIATRAARMHSAHGRWKEGKGARRENIKAIYSLIASNGTRDQPLVGEADQIAWMRKLPKFEQALQRRYLPLMAQCRLAFHPIPPTDKYDHIVVDEAQDVSPIEWNVLDEHLRADGAWTLVGDMNQRRSDTTYGSWREIGEHLGIGDAQGLAPQVMRRGYRSTGSILRFADKLLPTSQRGNLTVQDVGPAVDVRRVSKQADLWAQALDAANALRATNPAGSVALITVDPGSMMKELGRQGWRRPGGDLSVWSLADEQLRLFTPEEARGLEFDAVVVVEPGAFPENLGRTGQLYTSLTRANRELAVVWHRDLPDPLRRAARS